MNIIATNIYRIENLSGYSAKYRLHRVRGLPRGEDFMRNLHTLSNRLSRQLRTPATFLLRDDEPYIVLRADAPEPGPNYPLVRGTALLDASAGALALDFSNLDLETRSIALRFLQFALQGAFWRHRDLWQPHTGGTFFEKHAGQIGNTIGIHRGFLARVVDLQDGGFAICVDVRHKYVSTRPLPATMNRKFFNERFKGRNVVYHYGHEWFQIRLSEINDVSVTEYSIRKDGEVSSLLEYVQANSAKPLPPELAHLPKDSAAVHYFNNRDEQMTAPAALCYPLFDTASPEVRREHGRTLLSPRVRRQMIDAFTSNYLQNLRLDGQAFRLASNAVEIPQRYFRVPDLRFGGNKRLSVTGTSGAIPTRLTELGKKRLALLRDKSAGFIVTDPFQQQFFFMPKSIVHSWGPRFLEDLSKAVDVFYPQEHGYRPRLVPYNDSRGPTWIDQAQAIMTAASEESVGRGFAVVMLHEPGQQRQRVEDQLAAYVLRRFYDELDVRAAVMHTDTGSESYEMVPGGNRDVVYSVRSSKRGKLDGYIRNVALNKVLLTNEKWPFVLADPLHADITIGVDLKAQHTGFTLVGRRGSYIDTRVRKTRFREQLRTDEVERHLVEIVRQYHDRTGDFASTIVIHRDGRFFESELAGTDKGLKRLVDEGFVAPAASITCVEIGKHTNISLRLFDVKHEPHSGDLVRNPQVGQHFISTSNDGYVVATGFPFARDGTVLPLHVRKVQGPMSIEHVLEDVFWLTNLTWSRPEDCTRYPITIKLNDRRLFEDAGEYQEDEVELIEEEVET
jgi:hypothetical protein